jgi:DNA-binding LacI/PurR family transcriptional regulator
MTIDEFARAVGVSTTTVSRTLSGRGRISPATRQRILEKMRDLGYTPNVTAQRLAKGRTHTILLDCGTGSVFADVFMMELVRGIQKALERRGYGLLLNAPDGDPLRAVIGGAVDGVILVGGDSTGEEGVRPAASVAEVIAPHCVPCVVIGHQPAEEQPGVGSVVVGLESGAREAARMLTEYGHRRIAFISSMAEDREREAFRDELAKHGIDLPGEQVIVAGRTMEGGERAMRALLQQPKPPTAVATRTDTLAAGALRAAHRLGVRVPEDVSIIGHDDVPFATVVEPPLTTVRVDCARLGEEAAEMLLELLDKPGEAPAPRIVPTTLVVRETVVAPNAQRKERGCIPAPASR